MDPSDSTWEQPPGFALVRGPQVGEATDNKAMSTMFATWKAYDALESTYWFVTSEKNAIVRKAKKKVNKYKRAIKRL